MRNRGDPEAAALQFLRSQGYTVVDREPIESSTVKAFGIMLSKRGGDLFGGLNKEVVDLIDEGVFQSYDKVGVKPNFRGNQRRMIFLNTVRDIITRAPELKLDPKDVIAVSLFGNSNVVVLNMLKESIFWQLLFVVQCLRSLRVNRYR